jgi:iron complex outermembrane receptor protein
MRRIIECGGAAPGFVVALLVVATLGTAGGRADAAENDPTSLSLEHLGALQVSGVSRAQERLLDAPAPVSVLTADDIRSAGYRTLAELLNGARGMFTSTDRTYDFIGVRGFAPVGDYNTRVLLLIDGYRANDNVYDSASIGSEALIDLDLVERVELIRGPSSSVYGANAFFGVINVITRSASSVASGAALGAGSERTRSGSATLAGRLGDAGHFYVRATRERSDGGAIEFREAANVLPNAGRADGVNGEEVTRVSARGVFGRWRLTVGHVERNKESGYGLYGSDFVDPDAYSLDRHTYFDGRYERALGDATDWAARVFAARYVYRDRFVYSGDAWTGSTEGRWFGTEQLLTHRLSSAHRVIAGLEAQRDARLDQALAADSLGTLLDDRRTGSRFGVFVQDDVSWSTRWASSLGVRYDDYRGGHRVSPRGAVIFRPTSDSSLKLVGGSAFRAPNSYERYYAQPGEFSANPALRAESIRTIDLAYEASLGEATRVGLGAFRFRASDLVTQSFNSVGEAQFINLASASAYGFDGEIEHSFSGRLRVRGVLSTQRTVDAAGVRLENSPRYVARAGATWQIVPAGWNLGAEVVRVGERRSSSASAPAYSQLNLALTSPLRRSGLSGSVSVRNALDRRIEDPVPVGNLPVDLDRVPQPGRTWFARVEYAF